MKRLSINVLLLLSYLPFNSFQERLSPNLSFLHSYKHISSVQSNCIRTINNSRSLKSLFIGCTADPFSSYKEMAAVLPINKSVLGYFVIGKVITGFLRLAHKRGSHISQQARSSFVCVICVTCVLEVCLVHTYIVRKQL